MFILVVVGGGGSDGKKGGGKHAQYMCVPKYSAASRLRLRSLLLHKSTIICYVLLF